MYAKLISSHVTDEIYSGMANGRKLTVALDTHRNHKLILCIYRSVSEGYPYKIDLSINAQNKLLISACVSSHFVKFCKIISS